MKCRGLATADTYGRRVCNGSGGCGCRGQIVLFGICELCHGTGEQPSPMPRNPKPLSVLVGELHDHLSPCGLEEYSDEEAIDLIFERLIPIDSRSHVSVNNRRQHDVDRMD